MGMAEPPKREVRKPYCKGSVVCPVCHGEYDPKIEYSRGYYVNHSQSTSGLEFMPVSEVEKGKCPFCLTEQEE